MTPGADVLVPVTVIGGYLGAGKTTLVNRLLAADHGRRLAVLVNDVGAVNIDAALIAARHGDAVSLENGCICCSINDELGDALDRVLDLDPVPDQIIVEASGVADPAKVVAYAQGWPGCRLDAVVTLADVETVQTRADDRFVGELVTRQLRRADAVVITKCDLVNRERVDAVAAWITQTVGAVAVVESVDGRLDPALILDVVGSEPLEPRPPPNASGEPALDDDTIGWGEPALADDAIETMVLHLDRPVARRQLESALASWPPSVLRVKGVVAVDSGRPSQVVVHRVGRRTTIEPAPAGIDASVLDRLVVIGRRPLPARADLAASLHEASHDGPPR